jgi:hypothetical protein
MKSDNTSSMLSLMCLSLATSPFLISILILHFWGEWLQSMGKLSEELFRAEQLPLLHVKPSYKP